MNINRFFQLFKVKDRKFYPLFIAQLENITEAAEELRSLFLESSYENKKEYYKKIKELEKKGDHIAAKIFEELGTSLVTPFDREDIHSLASRNDTFLDFILDSARKLVMYKPATTYKDLIIIVDNIVEDAKILTNLMRQLEFITKKSDLILEECMKIKDIEHAVDDLYERFNSFLFENETDAIELVKHKNIVQSLEDTTDMAKEISDGIRSIIVKLA